MTDHTREYVHTDDDVRAQRLDYLLDFSEDGLWDWRLDTGEMFVSPVWLRMLGQTEPPTDDGDGIWSALGHPDDVARMAVVFAELRDGQREGYRAEIRLRHGSGRWLWILSRARVVERGADGQALRIMGTIQDITEARRVSDALRKSEHQLRETLDGLPIAVTLVGPDGSSLHHNAACERLTGLSRAGLSEVNTAALPWAIFDESGRRVQFPDHEVFAPWVEGRPTRGVMLAHFPLGASEPIWTLSDFVPHHNPDGSVRHVVCSFADVTLLRRMKASLMRTQRFEGLAHLAGAVAHDFNNLLATVLGSAEVVAISLPDEMPCREDLDRIVEAAQRGATLTHQLMSYARRQPVLPRVIDLGAKLRGMSDTLRRLLGRGNRLEMYLPAGPLQVVIDPSQFEQLVSNLIVNAREAMPGRGQVTLRLGVVAGAKHPDARELVTLRVADDGEGIPADVLPHIFDPMFTTRHLDAGAGLGLATCEGIVRQNGGRITVESRPGEGATFEISLPRARGDMNDDIPLRPTPQATEPGVLLLVEADGLMCDMACAALERSGYRVTKARDGADARAIAAETAVLAGVITADRLPDTDGPSLVARIARYHPRVPVLYMVNADGNRTEAGDGVRPEASFIYRPFGTNELCARVDALLAPSYF